MNELHIVRGIVRHGDKYLLLRKIKDINPNNDGKWEVPGGRFEGDENPEQALKREVEAETGLKFDKDIVLVRQLPSWYGVMKDFKSFAYVYLLDAKTEDVKIGDEHSEFAWKTTQEIKKIDLVAFAEVLFKYFEWIERGIL